MLPIILYEPLNLEISNKNLSHTDFYFNYTESSAFAFITAFISGVLVSMTLRLYKLSRNYRYVTRVLSKEKKALKQEKDFGRGHRIGTGRVWAPLPSVLRAQG